MRHTDNNVCHPDRSGGISKLGGGTRRMYGFGFEKGDLSASLRFAQDDNALIVPTRLRGNVGLWKGCNDMHSHAGAWERGCVL